MTDVQTETVSEVDAAALVAAQQALGTATPGETVNEALREAVRRRLVGDYVAYLRRQEPSEVLERAEQAWQ